ncbi:phage portal protein [Staphylococcus pseudintermedius]|uniref:phage portal protein n=1 Tax=Staphylococcus pseudintermedius TaxID=283734 RepID=UPI001136A8D2|nr:phage portal protein [Staphylococcus pseudintermedius]QIW00431.1 phage portal protein [Staphylococcus pseudintermedius]HAR5829554.1 phage portal protein [Staphylococcus pseudintermedius]
MLTFFNLHRDQQRPRLQELLDYYLTNNRGINKREGRDEPYADYRIAHAFVKNGTDFIRGYIGGNEITFRDEKYNEEIQNINDLNDAHVTNVEILEDCIIYGRAYEIVYRNVDNQDIFKRLDPKNVFVIYSNDIEVEPVAAVRYRSEKINGKDVTLIDFYTADYRAYFYVDDNRLRERADMPQEVNMHQMLQIHEYNANRFRQGVFENVLDLIDAYDYAESDTANYMTDLNDAMLKIEGHLDLKLEEVKKMRKSRIILAKTKADASGRMGNANVDFIYKQYDVAGVEAYKKRIQKDIHKFTNTPDLSDENFGGVQSGEAMKYKLFGLEQLRSTIERQLTKGFKRRFAIIQSVCNQLNDPIDLTHMRIEYKPNIPQSLSEYADIFIKLGGRVSQETLLSWLPNIENPKEELEKVKAEEQEASENHDYHDAMPLQQEKADINDVELE